MPHPLDQKPKPSCPTCRGVRPGVGEKQCEKHDVCVQCGIPRKELTEIPWGHEYGFLCQPCNRINEQKAIDDYQATNPDPLEFEHRYDVKCPFCGFESDPSSLSGGQCEDGAEIDFECPNCSSTMKVEVDISVHFTTRKPE